MYTDVSGQQQKMKEHSNFEKNDKNKWTKFVLRTLCIAPIILWPLIFYGSVFIFDDPNANETYQLLAFYGINAYPLIILMILILANKMFNKNHKLSIGLYLLPITLFALGFIWLFIA